MGDTLPCIHPKEKDLEVSGRWGHAKVIVSVEIVHAVFILKVIKGTAINSPQLENKFCFTCNSMATRRKCSAIKCIEYNKAAHSRSIPPG